MTRLAFIPFLALLTGCTASRLTPVPPDIQPPAISSHKSHKSLSSLPQSALGASIITMLPAGGYYFTNPVTGLSGTVPPQTAKDHIEIYLTDRLVRWTNSSGGAAFAVESADLYGTTNLQTWYYIGRLHQGYPITRPFKPAEFFHLTNAK